MQAIKFTLLLYMVYLVWFLKNIDLLRHFFAQIFQPCPLNFIVHPFFLCCPGRLCRFSLFSGDCRFLDDSSETLQSFRSILLLTAILLRLDDNMSILGQSMVPQGEQSFFIQLRQ